MKYRSKQEVFAHQLPDWHKEDLPDTLATMGKVGTLERAANGYIITDHNDEDEQYTAMFGDYLMRHSDGTLQVVDKETFENLFEPIGTKHNISDKVHVLVTLDIEHDMNDIYVFRDKGDMLRYKDYVMNDFDEHENVYDWIDNEVEVR